MYIAQRWYWRGLCKISKTCVNWKVCYWLTRFCEFWVWDEFRMDIRLHWTAPLEPGFFSYTMSRVSNLVRLRFVLVECFSYHYCSRIRSPAQFVRYIDGQYYLYQYYSYWWLHHYIYSCSTHTHGLALYSTYRSISQWDTYPNIIGVLPLKV